MNNQVQPTPNAGGRVTLREMLAYGSGGLTDFFFLNVVLSLATQIYVTGMGMNMALLGVALAIAKTVSAACAPLFGAWSDNTRGRWGRRRPYILLAGIAGAVLLPFLWCVPHGSHWLRFVYIAGMFTVFSVLFTAFSVPYGALGFEMTTDYDERTRVFAWKGYLGAFGALAAAWFYKFCTLRIFPNEVAGARWLSVIVGVLMCGGALATFFFCRERTLRHEQPPVPIGEALRLTVRNKPFMLLQAANQILMLALAITSSMGWYVFLYYVCGGDKQRVADISAFGGSIAFATSLGANALGVAVSARLGKRRAGVTGFALVVLSIVILPWTLTAAHPWWNVAAWVIAGLGVPMISLMAASMTADVCDEDELETGLRREGAFSAVNSLFGRIMQLLIVLVGNVLPWLVGFREISQGTGQIAPPSLDLLVRMKWLLIGVQLAGVLLAFGFFRLFPITRRRSEETRRILDERNRGSANSSGELQPVQIP